MILVIHTDCYFHPISDPDIIRDSDEHPTRVGEVLISTEGLPYQLAVAQTYVGSDTYPAFTQIIHCIYCPHFEIKD